MTSQQQLCGYPRPRAACVCKWTCTSTLLSDQLPVALVIAKLSFPASWRPARTLFGSVVGAFSLCTDADLEANEVRLLCDAPKILWNLQTVIRETFRRVHKDFGRISKGFHAQFFQVFDHIGRPRGNESLSLIIIMDTSLQVLRSWSIWALAFGWKAWLSSFATSDLVDLLSGIMF